MRTARMTIMDLQKAICRLERDPTDLMGFEGDVKNVMEQHVAGSEDGEGPIPELIQRTLDLYKERKFVQPGSCLRAILEGDLVAITRADADTFGSIKTIFRWIYNELPNQSWGSSSKVFAWLAAAEEEA